MSEQGWTGKHNSLEKARNKASACCASPQLGRGYFWGELCSLRKKIESWAVRFLIEVWYVHVWILRHAHCSYTGRSPSQLLPPTWGEEKSKVCFLFGCNRKLKMWNSTLNSWINRLWSAIIWSCLQLSSLSRAFRSVKWSFKDLTTLFSKLKCIMHSFFIFILFWRSLATRWTKYSLLFERNNAQLTLTHLRVRSWLFVLFQLVLHFGTLEPQLIHIGLHHGNNPFLFLQLLVQLLYPTA